MLISGKCSEEKNGRPLTLEFFIIYFPPIYILERFFFNISFLGITIKDFFNSIKSYNILFKKSFEIMKQKLLK